MNSIKASMTKVKQDQEKHCRERKHICQICEKGFTQKCHLNNHMLKHSGDKPFKCETCNQQFSLKGNLDRHSFIHSDLKPFKCPTCFKQFNQKEHLNKHVLIHSDKKPFECLTCSKQFRCKGDLKQHMQIHSQEKAHECPKCLKQFRWRQHFKEHIKLGCDEESLKCPTCEKTFTTKGGLNRHVRGVHQKDRSFICDICKTGFPLKHQVKVHLRCHSGDKPFSCSTCKRAFAQKSNLIRHHKRHLKQKLDASLPYVYNVKKHSQFNPLLSDGMMKREMGADSEPNASDFCFEVPLLKREPIAEDESTPSCSYQTLNVKREPSEPEHADATCVNLLDDSFVKEESETCPQ